MLVFDFVNRRVVLVTPQGERKPVDRQVELVGQGVPPGPGLEEQPADPDWMVKGGQNNHQSGRRTTGVRHWQKKK
jgi:hypothetical protein